MIDLNLIKSRLEKLQEGTWKTTDLGIAPDTFKGVISIHPNGEWTHVCSFEDAWPFENEEANAEFVAHSRQDIVSLIKEIEESREKAKQTRNYEEEHKANLDAYGLLLKVIQRSLACITQRQVNTAKGFLSLAVAANEGEISFEDVYAILETTSTDILCG
jgi:hypothetical protein